MSFPHIDDPGVTLNARPLHCHNTTASYSYLYCWTGIIHDLRNDLLPRDSRCCQVADLQLQLLGEHTVAPVNIPTPPIGFLVNRPNKTWARPTQTSIECMKVYRCKYSCNVFKQCRHSILLERPSAAQKILTRALWYGPTPGRVLGAEDCT
jgi:hypothetical protein